MVPRSGALAFRAVFLRCVRRFSPREIAAHAVIRFAQIDRFEDRSVAELRGTRTYGAAMRGCGYFGRVGARIVAAVPFAASVQRAGNDRSLGDAGGVALGRSFARVLSGTVGFSGPFFLLRPVGFLVLFSFRFRVFDGLFVRFFVCFFVRFFFVYFFFV